MCANRPFHLTSLPAAFLISRSWRKEVAAGSSGCERQQDKGSVVELDGDDTISRKLARNSTDAVLFVPLLRL